MGGIVGIAGGIILNPLFISMGMITEVLQGTSQYIVLISTISVSIQFLYISVVNIPYAIFLGIF